MKTLLIENQKLEFILKQIVEGGFGVDSNDFLITNNKNEEYKNFAIKSSLIDISDKIVESIGDIGFEVDSFESEIFEFVCYSFIEELNSETNKIEKTCICASLTEILSYSEDKDILSTEGWNCYSLENY